MPKLDGESFSGIHKRDNMKKVVVLTGAGISKESGIPTFRDVKDGLWHEHKIEDVASPIGFMRDPGLVLKFYNERRRKLADVEPNQAHLDIAMLEDYYDVHIITQNIDDLHERAGSTKICHIHGEITKAKTNMNMEKKYDIGYEDINLGDEDEEGYQLRPDVVWFGESVTKLPEAERIARSADIFIIVGTSMAVFPASTLYRLVPQGAPMYIVDPSKPGMSFGREVTFIEENATTGVRKVVSKLVQEVTGGDPIDLNVSTDRRKKGDEVMYAILDEEISFIVEDVDEDKKEYRLVTKNKVKPITIIVNWSELDG